MGEVMETWDRIEASTRTASQNVITEFCEARGIEREDLRDFLEERGDLAMEEMMDQGGVAPADLYALACAAFHCGFEMAAKRYLDVKLPGDGGIGG